MNNETVPLKQYLSETQALKAEVMSLKEQIDWFRRQVFGQSSEKIIQNPSDQLILFDLPSEPEPKKVKIESHSRVKKNQNKSNISFPEDIPVKRTIYDLDDKDKFCKETGEPLKKIGEDVTQKLAFKPGSYFIKEAVRPKYASKNNSEETVISANLPDSLLSKCKADESLLAEICVRKFVDHLPLYRQSEILSREGICISRQVLSKWVTRCGLALKPLYNELIKEILDSKNVFIDEVPVPMLKPTKGRTHQAYMWVMVGGKEGNSSLCVYNFRDNRRYENAEQLLGDFKDGVVHSDKYGAYEVLANKKKFIWSPCWAHIRRKFYEAEGGDNKFIRLVIRKIRYLFMFERIAWSRSAEERLRIRKEKEVPIIDELIELIKDKFVNGKVLPKSKYKEALGYFLGLIPYLKNYTLHPFARLDNNVAERAVRPLALGRKNWLFVGSEESGEASSVILSLVQTCKAIGINPSEYLEDVMRRIMSHNSLKIAELLPHNWKKHPNI